jgi:hypothetical protein
MKTGITILIFCAAVSAFLLLPSPKPVQVHIPPAVIPNPYLPAVSPENAKAVQLAYQNYENVQKDRYQIYFEWVLAERAMQLAQQNAATQTYRHKSEHEDQHWAVGDDPGTQQVKRNFTKTIEIEQKLEASTKQLQDAINQLQRAQERVNSASTQNAPTPPAGSPKLVPSDSVEGTAQTTPPLPGTILLMKPEKSTTIPVCISIALLLPCLLIILLKHYGPKEKHWAYATVGTILGYWLKG